MSGRQENNIKNEAKTTELIKDYPLLQDYYNYKVDNTAKGKQLYCRYIIDYFKYLISEGKDVNDHMTFSKVRMVDISRYMATLRYYKTKTGETKEMGASIRNCRLAAIRSFYDFMKKSGYINSNPCDDVPNPKVKVEKEVVYLEKDQVDQMKKMIDDSPRARYTKQTRERDKLLITLAARTGLRETALSEINIADIDFEHNKIIVTEKGNITREVFIGNNTAADIKNYLPYRDMLLKGTQCDALFVSERKSRMCVRAIIDVVEKTSLMVGKKITPHKLRSTCAVNLYEQTGDIYLVKEVLGHKNVANTQRYARASVTKRRHAADIMDNL